MLLFFCGLNYFEPKPLFLHIVWYIALGPLIAGGASPPKDTSNLCTKLDVEHQDFDGNSYEE